MTLREQAPPFKGSGEDVAVAPSDPRVSAFVRLVNAVDATDASAGIKASRELRRLGFSVCLVTPRTEQGVAR